MTDVNITSGSLGKEEPPVQGLPHGAYEGVEGQNYQPFISTNQAIPELTLQALIVGCLFAAIFAAANVYLGLQIGITVAAGIPAAILGTGLLKLVLKNNNILEANLVQTVGAMGESIASGLIFTIPAIYIWKSQGLDTDTGFMTVFLCIAIGGALGIFLLSPVRKYLVVQEHSKLTFPESMAISEMLVSSNVGGNGLRVMMQGIGFGAIYKLLSGGLRFWQDAPEWTIKPLNTLFGVNAFVSTTGIGFIVGMKVAISMFAGAVLAWFGIVPLITYLGSFIPDVVYPATVPISEMSPISVWSNYVRYIGAGAVAAGGFISLAESLPAIIRSFNEAFQGMRQGGGASTGKRYELETPLSWVIAITVIAFLLVWLLPIVGAQGGTIGFVGALLVMFFSFFFGVVSGRMVGIIGVSNNPVSGMTIASLLVITLVLKTLGYVGDLGMLTAITAVAIVCVAVSTSGGSNQSLKTTFIIGGTPKNIQWAMYAGVLVAGVAATAVMLMLASTYGFGSQEVPAPQAMLMALLIKGVMTADLPWIFVIVGLFMGCVFRMLKAPVLAVALGLYLPIHLSASIMFGALIRSAVEFAFRKSKEQKQTQIDRGILLSSGLVAGGAITGVLLAIVATLGLNIDMSHLLPALSQNPYVAGAIYLGFGVWMYRKICKKEAS